MFRPSITDSRKTKWQHRVLAFGLAGAAVLAMMVTAHAGDALGVERGAVTLSGKRHAASTSIDSRPDPRPRRSRWHRQRLGRQRQPDHPVRQFQRARGDGAASRIAPDRFAVGIMNNLSHRTAMAAHTTKRLFQRHGLAMSHGEYWLLCKTIDDGKAPPICPAFNGTGATIHCLEYAGRQFYAVWNPTERAIATVLSGRPKEIRLHLQAQGVA